MKAKYRLKLKEKLRRHSKGIYNNIISPYCKHALRPILQYAASHGASFDVYDTNDGICTLGDLIACNFH